MNKLAFAVSFLTIFVHENISTRNKIAPRRTLWACASDMIVLCPHIEPGEGRIENCLHSKQSFLTSMCSEKRRTAENVPSDCAGDILDFCSDERENGHRLVCLRRNRKSLSQACWNKISKLRSDGWEMLPSRFRTFGVDSPCAYAVLQASRNVLVGYGALRDCVDANWNLLADSCGLRRRVIPEDIPEVCERDALIVCKHVVKGNDQVHRCLRAAAEGDGAEGDSYASELSPHCHAALRLQSADLSVLCAGDLVELCSPRIVSREQMLDCLHRHQER